jgi:hypothetical protein
MGALNLFEDPRSQLVSAHKKVCIHFFTLFLLTKEYELSFAASRLPILTVARKCEARHREITFDSTLGLGYNFWIILCSICVKGSESVSSIQQCDQKLFLATSHLKGLMLDQKCGLDGKR